MKQDITMREMQQEVDDYIQQFKTGYFSPLAQMARMTEETGELAREINHYYGEKKKKPDEEANTVAEELADVLIVAIMMANSLDIDLSEQFERNMAKFNRRDAFRFERKDGRVANGGNQHES